MALGRGLSSLIQSKKNSVAAGSFSSGSSNVGSEKEQPTTENRVWSIPVSLIRANPHQPRKNFYHQDLEDLMKSIRVHGIIQPIVVTESADGHYELIAGERR